MREQTDSFSSRLEMDLRPNQLARLLAAKASCGARVLDLTESNPTRAGLPHEEESILGSLTDPAALVYDPTAQGLPEARAAVARYHRTRGANVDPEDVLLTASTSEAYSFLLKLLTDPGDDVLVPQPSYPLFEFLARMESVELRRYPLSYRGGWLLDAEAVRRAASLRTRAIIVVNPNNPTGSYLKRAELEALLSLCSERRIALIADEVFHDYALQDDLGRASVASAGQSALSFTLSGLSKLAGLPQMKLGWILVRGPADLRAAALERLELIADTYLSVSATVQHAAARLLELAGGFQRAVLCRVQQNLDYLRKACRDVLTVEGGWYAIVELPEACDEEEWVLRLLDEENVLVQPGFFYDFPSGAHIVISLLTEPETFREGVERVARRLKEAPCP